MNWKQYCDHSVLLYLLTDIILAWLGYVKVGYAIPSLNISTSEIKHCMWQHLAVVHIVFLSFYVGVC